jgi:hypothetical protein
VAASRRIRIILFSIAAVLAAFVITAFVLVNRFQPVARSYVISALRDRYNSDVELGDFQISLFPLVHATGDNLVFHMKGRKDGPPLIRIRRFTVEARFIGFFRYPRRIRSLTLEGLEIHIPPKQARTGETGGASPASTPFILEKVVANGATLETLPADPQKDPLTFQISQLTMHTVGKSESMTFHAELNNAKPPGFIHSDGTFGPWNQDEPGDTPLSGHYTFSNADLSVFKSISGTLSSSGDYRGQLASIDVHGTTDVPDFALTMGGHAEHLRTEFQATVDGTNGNTDLHPVQALLGASKFEVTGSIERNALEKRKEIDLNASAKGTGLADFLRLAIKSPQPPMKGTIAFNTKVKIPPGDNPVIGRLQLDGSFTMNHVMFTSDDVQQKIASLSHRAQGEPKDTDTRDVTAQFAGKFSLRNGTLNLPNLRFDVPGANIALNGQYGVQSGEINFKGTAKLDATVSQMATGLKHVLLKPVDPLFRHDGAGTVLPIEISGTRGSPSFRLDIGKVLRDSGK